MSDSRRVKRRTAKPSRPAPRRAARAAGAIEVSRPDWLLMHPWLREAGVWVTSETASQVSAVYGCARLIVDCIAPASVVVSEIQDDGVRKTRHDDQVGWTLNYGAAVQDAPDAPTAQAVKEALFWSVLTGDGNGYAEIQRDGSGKFFALWPIEAERVTPRRDETGYYYEIRQPTGGTGRLNAMDMFHLRGPSLRGYVGDSIIYRAAKAIGIAHGAQVYAAAYLANGTVVSGLLTSDKMITPAQATAAKNEWTEKYGGGPDRQHGVAVLGQGIKYQPVNHDAGQAQLVEQRRFQVAELARFYGVPLTLLADNEAWTNLSELYRGFYQNCLRPWAKRFDAEATRKLLPRRQPWREVSHDLTHLTLGSFKEMIDAGTKAAGGPIWTPNEVRSLFGKPSIDGGDELKTAPAQPAVPDGRPGVEPPDDDASDPVRTRTDLTASELERHGRRVRARTADLVAKGVPPKVIAEHVGRLRQQATANMRAVMGDINFAALGPALESVEHGVDPRKAAAHALGVA